MTEDMFFILFNTILATLVLVLFYPLFQAKSLTELDEALETRPFLARALQRKDARNYFYPFLYCGLPLAAYYWLADGDDGGTDMQLAMLSIVVLFAVSIARVWKFRRLLLREENILAAQEHLPDFPEEDMAGPEAADNRVEQTAVRDLMSSAPRPDAVRCPVCSSLNISSKNYAKRTGGAIGTMAGAAAGVAGVAGGAEIGAAVGLVGGPVGVALGSLSGAIIGALVGGATGCAAGQALGSVVDETLLDNYLCRECNCTFNRQNG